MIAFRSVRLTLATLPNLPAKNMTTTAKKSPALPPKLRKAHYMCEEQQRWFESRLRDDISEATKRLDRLRSDEAQALTGDVGDEVDRASAEAAAATRNKEIIGLTQLVSQCRAALDRLDDGEYGYCTKTGEPIGLDRLVAVPHAHLCIAAAERAERSEAMYARSAAA